MPTFVLSRFLLHYVFYSSSSFFFFVPFRMILYHLCSKMYLCPRAHCAFHLLSLQQPKHLYTQPLSILPGKKVLSCSSLSVGRRTPLSYLLVRTSFFAFRAQVNALLPPTASLTNALSHFARLEYFCLQLKYIMILILLTCS